MLKIVGVVLLTVVVAVNAQGSGLLDLLQGLIGRPNDVPKDSCNCIQTVPVEIPANVSTYSDRNFINGLRKEVSDNYEIINQQLQEKELKCDFWKIKISLNNIKYRTSQTISILTRSYGNNIDTFFEYLKEYVKVKLVYNAQMRMAVATQPIECAKILSDIRFLPLVFAEHIQATVLSGLYLRQKNNVQAKPNILNLF